MIVINYFNQFFFEGKKIIYKVWDMSRVFKVRGGDVIGNFEKIVELVFNMIGFFQNGDGQISFMMVQNGVVRMNCIDCFDRMNVVQFVIGKCVFGYQFYVFGILENIFVEYDMDVVNFFIYMWYDYGDIIVV